MQEYNVIIEEGEDCYLISEVIELPGCHTQAKSLDKLNERIKEAIELYLEEEKYDEQLEFVGIQQVEI